MANVKAEPGIKPDPDRATASPGALSDDDVYEDAGDLEFYDPSIPNDPYGSVYLTHLPKYLYDQWAQLNEDEELVIGKVRTWNEVDKKGQQKSRLAMLVDPKNPIHQTVPKEYNLELKEADLLNTFMFTEQDLPGFKNKSQGGPNSNIPAHLRPRPDRPKETPESKGVKKKPFYRKAIPKKTVLAGRFRHELNCQPVETAETKHILAMRASDALKPKATTSLMTGTRNPTGIIHAGTTAGNEKMRGFIVGAHYDIIEVNLLTLAAYCRSQGEVQGQGTERESCPHGRASSARRHFCMLQTVFILVHEIFQATLESARGVVTRGPREGCNPAQERTFCKQLAGASRVPTSQR
jgi:hypothetical protein